jgi:hypothetical protein
VVNDFVEFLAVIAQAISGEAIRQNPVVCGVDISRTVLKQSIVSVSVASAN